MATIEERLKNVRTMEDIVYLLSILFTNLNNQNEIYYDMFINTTPMDIELERYDENGELVTVTLPNRAKDRIWIQTGSGSPIGKVAARVGSLYLDTYNQNLYFKSGGSDESSVEWEKVWSANNLVKNLDFLPPNGNGSQLTDLNAGSITSGTLSVPRGGTGATSITSGYLVQGHGVEPFTGYSLGSVVSSLEELIGMIMWCPMSSITGNWLVCDGAAYSRTTYASLFSKIGTKYGSGNGSTTFNVPNLINRYVKGGNFSNVGTYEAGSVLSHSHDLNNASTSTAGDHTHGGGSLQASGWLDLQIAAANLDGRVFQLGDSVKGKNAEPGGTNDKRVYLRTAGNWTGTTGSGGSHSHTILGSTSSTGSSTNEVNHLILVPVIRY